MNKKHYDQVGIISVLLNEKLKELDKCQKQKEAILKEIDELMEKNELEANYPKIKEKMDANLKAFEKVVADIKKLNNIEIGN